jgi:hypothetical protein
MKKETNIFSVCEIFEMKNNVCNNKNGVSMIPAYIKVWLIFSICCYLVPFTVFTNTVWTSVGGACKISTYNQTCHHQVLKFEDIGFADG